MFLRAFELSNLYCCILIPSPSLLLFIRMVPYTCLLISVQPSDRWQSYPVEISSYASLLLHFYSFAEINTMHRMTRSSVQDFLWLM